jgi:hypothetical protein
MGDGASLPDQYEEPAPRKSGGALDDSNDDTGLSLPGLDA